MGLIALVAEAQLLAGEHPCEKIGHRWVTVGGRMCPNNCPDHIVDRSQPVYRCARCGEYDYGHPGGPGYADCIKYCGIK